MDALASLLARPEGKTIEHKRDLTSPQSALKTLIAFANTAGGTLLIGVEDGTRDVVGVDDVLAIEERLAWSRSSTSVFGASMTSTQFRSIF